jgi:hypothetical protein
MKSEAKFRGDYSDEKKYPRLMINKIDGAVYLFSTESAAILVYPGDLKVYEVGDQFVDLQEKIELEDYNGTIELSND